jgi:hypothetical protein
MPSADAKQQLADALKQAKRGPMRFAFVIKGPAEGKLLVARKTIPAKEIAEAKKELGGGKVYRGRCEGEMGALVCEVAQEPPATLAKELKGIITRDAGPLFRAVEFRVVADLAEEEEGAAPPEGVPSPPPPPPGDAKTAVLKRLSALAGPYQAAVAAQGPDVARMQSLFAAVKGLVGNQDFAQAGKVLDELEPLVARGRAVRPGTPPVGDGAARFTARLKALLPQIQRAQGAASPVSQEIKLRVSEANTLARKNEFAQANALLDQIEALLKQPVGTGGVDLAAEWQKSLAAWTPAIKAALAAKGPNAAAIAKLFTQATALAKPGGDMALALAQLTKCHALATAGPHPAAAVPAGAPAAVSNVVFTQTRLVWDAARKRIQAELNALVKSIHDTVKKLNENADAEEEVDPAELQKGIGKLQMILEKLDERLIDRLDEALNAADPKIRQAKHQEAKGIVSEYLAYVSSDPLMAIIDDNGLTATKILATAEAALKTLSSKL